jgi:hypothetical protein
LTRGGIEKARSEARRLQTLIDQGVDPRDEKTEQKAAKAAQKAKAQRQADAEAETARRQAVLVADAWKIYIEDRTSRWGARHLQDHINLAQPGGEAKKRGKGLTAPGSLAPLLALRLVQITPERMTDWLREESVGRATQTLLPFGLFKTFGVWCEERADYRGLLDPAAFTA